MPEAPTAPPPPTEATRPTLVDPHGRPLAASAHETPLPSREQPIDVIQATNTTADTTGNDNASEPIETSPPVPESISKERQNSEVDSIAMSIVYQRDAAITRTLKGKSISEQREYFQQHPLDNNIRFMQLLQRQGNWTFDPPQQIDNVTVRGTQILNIRERQGNELLCEVSGHSDTVERFSIEDVVNGQMRAIEQPLISASSPGEATVLRAYYARLGGASHAPQPEELNAALKEAATDAGILTTDDLRSFAAALPQEAQPVILDALKGKNIADPDTIITVLNAAGINSKNLAEQAQSASQAARQALQALASDPENPALQQNLKQAQALEKMLRMAVDTLDQGGIKNYFEQMAKGQIDKTRSRELASAFRSGDVNTIISMIMKENENDTPEQKEEKQRMRLELGKYAEGAGVGAGILFVLLMMMAFSGLSQGFRQH